jgi:hypothetical protein
MQTNNQIKFKNNQVVGNVGLFYICYELCKRGWNAMPTSRDARGVDILIYSQDGKKKYSIQTKSLTKKSPVPIGTSLDGLIADYIIICRSIFEKPEIFIAETRMIINRIHKGVKNEKISYWLQPKDYEEFRDNWKVIGEGFN